MFEAKDKIGKDEREPSFELVLEKLGPVGRFQVVQIFCCFTSMFVLSSTVLSFVFEGYEPPHVCKAVNETDLLSKYGLHNDSSARVIYESCDLRIVSNQSGKGKEIDVMKCPNGRDFLGAKHTTFLSEWDLVCESSGVAELSQTCFTTGQMIGAVVGPAITDRFGRKPVFISSSFLTALVEWCVAAAPNIFVVYGLKLASGALYQALMCCFFVYAMEFTIPHHREANGGVSSLVWVFGTLGVGVMAFLFRNESWRYFQGWIGVSGLCCLVYPFVMHESPRWLAANGKTDKALGVLEKASKMNGKNFEEVKQAFVAYINHAFPSSNSSHSLPIIRRVNQGISPENDNDDDFVIIVNKKSDKKPNRKNILDLIRSKSLRRSTLIAWYLYLTNMLTYYGIFMTSSDVAGDRFVNFTLLTLVELPSIMCMYYMMKRYSRRVVMVVFLSLTTVSLTTSTLLVTFAHNINGSGLASTAFFILGKFAITASFNAVFIFVPEIFPTNLRSTAVGVCSGLGRVGAIMAPFLRPLFNIVKWGPGLIFTVMCFISIVLTLLLPESKDTNLPDTEGDVAKNSNNSTKQAASQ